MAPAGLANRLNVAVSQQFCGSGVWPLDYSRFSSFNLTTIVLLLYFVAYESATRATSYKTKI